MISVKTSQEISEKEYVEFRDLVRKGTEIFPKTLPELKEKARFLAFDRNERGDLVGIGGIKVLNPDLRNKVFEKVRSSFDPRLFTVELGWFRVQEGHADQGIEKGILKALMERIGGERPFALLRADSAELIAVLKASGFRKTGTEIASTRGDYFFVLYARE